MSEFRFFSYSDFQFKINESQNFLNLPISPYYSTERASAAYRDASDAGGDDALALELNVPYTVFEILVAIFAVVGNLMVIIVFQRERKLRRRTNYYIVSLAMADFLVGSLGVPFAILASIGLPTNLYACLFTVSLLVVLCTISIFCLVAVSVDRYWAILYPMAYSRNVRTKTAIVIISLCWLAGTVVGFLPLFGWHADVAENQQCLFTEVMDYDYLVFLYFATIITPALLMLAFYAHIYKVIIKQVRQIVTMNPIGDCSRRSSTAQIQTASTTGSSRTGQGGTMLRVLGASRKRDVKATQNLSIIVLFFMICWFPLYTINCIKAFCRNCEIHPKLTLFCIILSHLNSAGNPVLYAYHLKDFRAALKNLILKFMGVDVEPTIDPTHRFSLASQHRLHSIDANMRNAIQPRIYIDSPIWLRQQQEQSLKHPKLMTKCGVVTPCLNNITQTVAAVASATTDIERNMWNLMEVSIGAELGEVNYEFPPEDNQPTTSTGSQTPTPPPRHHRPSQLSERCGSPFSYDNCNYSNSAEEDDFEEVFLPSCVNNVAVDPKQLHQSLMKCKMLEKLRSDDAEYQTKVHSNQRALTDSSLTDNELPKDTRSEGCTPPQGKLTTAGNCLAHSNNIYIIDDKSALSPTACKRKYKKSQRLPANFAKSNKALTRSCSCTSDTPMPAPNTEPARRTSVNSGNSNSSNSLNAIAVCTCGHSNNNLHTANNLNYYTIPQQQHNKLQQLQQHQCHPEKFSPLRAVSKIIFPPIVKHSSLFQLFQPSATPNDLQTTTPVQATTPATIAAAAAATTTTDSTPERTKPAAANDTDSLCTSTTEVVFVEPSAVTTPVHT